MSKTDSEILFSRFRNVALENPHRSEQFKAFVRARGPHGIERTSVTRTLATNADYFDTELQTYDQKTKRYVTLYRLKDKMDGTL